MATKKIFSRTELAERRRASARKYNDLRNELGRTFQPAQQEAIDKWLAEHPQGGDHAEDYSVSPRRASAPQRKPIMASVMKLEKNLLLSNK